MVHSIENRLEPYSLVGRRVHLGLNPCEYENPPLIPDGKVVDVIHVEVRGHSIWRLVIELETPVRVEVASGERPIRYIPMEFQVVAADLPFSSEELLQALRCNTQDPFQLALWRATLYGAPSTSMLRQKPEPHGARYTIGPGYCVLAE